MSAKGEAHGRAKLTEAQVRLARRLYRTSKTAPRREALDGSARGRVYERRCWDSVSLAKRFGVSKRTMARVLRGELWGHVRGS